MSKVLQSGPKGHNRQVVIFASLQFTDERKIRKREEGNATEYPFAGVISAVGEYGRGV